ncbi:gibberellin 2-beta-dioxygenase 6-like [Primulina tabacum]|uniref:gibberellin 2-beta-dioxygenase 6-like n=1 Tax=Primulina tabacum TaxID=48773 RepID=UPI003F5A9E00
MIYESNPTLDKDFNKLLLNHKNDSRKLVSNDINSDQIYEVEELPLIDLRGLTSGDDRERVECMEAIARASSEWGFFQIVNHGVSVKLLTEIRREQIKLFNAPFKTKSSLGLLNNSYRWGSTTANSPENFSWSEAFHISLTKISDPACYGEFDSLREVLVEYAATMQKLAKLLTGVLMMNLSSKNGGRFEDTISCEESTCFLRLNHYPICPLSAQQQVFGLVPHTDSDYLTILHQDRVGGLQLMKDSKWVAVKPNQDALIVNIGDLFQAWSNDVYKSVKHKVMSNTTMERFSVAYFLCPSYDSFVGSCKKPSLYKDFTFGEYRSQVQQDTRTIGYKVGLPRFRREQNSYN